MHTSKPKRPKHVDYDLIVIGSGAGGGVAAFAAASSGKRVAIVENSVLGGECPNFACIPTKALLQAAEVYESTKLAPRFGIRAASVVYNYRSVKAWKDTAVQRTGVKDSENVYKHENITVLHGYAHFIDPWTISLGHRRLSASRFLIATGARSIVPTIEGLEETGFITYKEAINLTQLPRSIFIIGGGAIGCELAQIFVSFGSKVHIAESAPLLLAREDAQVGKLVKAIFIAHGANVYTTSKILSVSSQKDKKIVTLLYKGQRHHIRVSEVLLASGKAPNTDLGLENAGVKYSQHGIATNENMQSSAKHIYAAGDVVGPYAFTHTATYQGRIAVHNMFSRKKVRAVYHAVPRVTFLSPEVAAVGATEDELKAKSIAYQSGITPVSIIARANTSNSQTGFVKVLASHTGVLLGASIVSPNAGEMIHELALAIHHGMKATAITDVIHAFPTWSEAVRVACSQINCQ